MTTTEGLRYIDSDGHILEHPTAMPDYAPAEYRDRVWHIETDEKGVEYLHYNGTVMPSNGLSLAGTAGFPDEKVDQVRNGEIRYSEVRPAAHNAKARLVDMDTDGIDLAVLYPTSMLGLQSIADEDFARVQARAYNDWASDHTQEGEGRLFAAGAVPPMNDEDGVAAVAAEIRRVAEKPGMVSVFLRPNPSVDWRPFNDKVYDPVWQAAAETGLVLAFHPFLMPDLPGACRGLKLARPFADWSYAPSDQEPEGGWEMGNILFTQAIANPVDVMHSIAYVTAGGVCERFPDTKFLFLEANGGWLVPWLERLDHHSKKFEWDVPWLNMLPSEYFRRQCWISFDPDESMLAFTANSPLCGADRIVWASDYPHPDAKFPGVTEELAEALEPLSFEQQSVITSESARWRCTALAEARRPGASGLDLDTVDKLLTTTRAVRKRLDLTRPVELDVILECLRLAIQAPTGSNQQTWRWIVVTDPKVRAQLAELYRNLPADRPAARLGSTPPPAEQQQRVMDSSSHLMAHIDEVPLFVVPCIEDAGGAAGWPPSIYPAVWSFMLALRSRGLGSVITTVHLYRREEADELLGVPEGFVQACLLPVAYYTGDDFKPADRRPVEAVTFLDHWGEPPVT